MGDGSIVLTRAPEAMHTGKLPDRRPDRMWGGSGSGASCALCGNPVRNDEVEFELEYRPNGSPGAANYHVHARCFAAWELERRNGASQGNSLPRSGDGGIVLGRERNASTQRGRVRD